MKRFKHPRTFHVPHSPGATQDDKIHKNLSFFENKEIVITEKRDGECTSLYSDGYIHARSIDGTSHPWQHYLKNKWSSLFQDLPVGWRIVGENLYARHSIEYNNLYDYFEVFAIFNNENIALSWDEMVDWCELYDLRPVPLLWRGVFDKTMLNTFHHLLSTEQQEGYVMRVSSRIQHWSKETAKWVRSNHVSSDEHWTKKWQKNTLQR